MGSGRSNPSEENGKFRVGLRRSWRDILGKEKVYSEFGLAFIPSTFFLSFFLNYLFILLYNIVLVLPYIDLTSPWVYICSPSWTPLPTPSPSHPSGSSQCASPEHPVSCIKPGLAIRFTYDNLHVLMSFFHIIPPSPSPTESKRLFNTSVSLLLSHVQVIITIFLNSIYMH